MTTFPSHSKPTLYRRRVARLGRLPPGGHRPGHRRDLRTGARATDADIDEALEAPTGIPHWRKTDAWTRSRVLRRVADLLRDWADEAALVMTSEQGKPLAEAYAEWSATADQFDWYADEARRIYGRTVDGHSTANRIFVVREPIGVVAAFAAWNFPRCCPPARWPPPSPPDARSSSAGEEAPFSTLLLAEACAQAGVPAGVVTMLTGARLISERLIARPPSGNSRLPVPFRSAGYCCMRRRNRSLRCPWNSAGMRPYSSSRTLTSLLRPVRVSPRIS